MGVAERLIFITSRCGVVTFAAEGWKGPSRHLLSVANSEGTGPNGSKSRQLAAEAPETRRSMVRFRGVLRALIVLD